MNRANLFWLAMVFFCSAALQAEPDEDNLKFNEYWRMALDSFQGRLLADVEFGYSDGWCLRGGYAVLSASGSAINTFAKAGLLVEYNFDRQTVAVVPSVHLGFFPFFAGVGLPLTHPTAPTRIRYDLGVTFLVLRAMVSTTDFQTATYFVGFSTPMDRQSPI